MITCAICGRPSGTEDFVIELRAAQLRLAGSLRTDAELASRVGADEWVPELLEHVADTIEALGADWYSADDAGSGTCLACGLGSLASVA